MESYLGGCAVVLESDVALADGVGDAHPALGQHGVVLALSVVARLALPTCSTDILLSKSQEGQVERFKISNNDLAATYKPYEDQLMCSK